MCLPAFPAEDGFAGLGAGERCDRCHESDRCRFFAGGEKRHLDYWDRHSLPVMLVLHNPVDGMTLWRRIERHLVTEHTDSAWSITLHKWQKLDANSADPILRSLPRSDRRKRMMLDAPLIRRVGALADIVAAGEFRKCCTLRPPPPRFGFLRVDEF